MSLSGSDAMSVSLQDIGIAEAPVVALSFLFPFINHSIFEIVIFAELSVPTIRRYRLLSLTSCHTQRFETTKSSHRRGGKHQTGRLWTGEGVWYTVENVYTRGKV